MVAKSYSRGYEIEYSKKGEWIYYDTKESITKKRKCKRCKCFPTKEGYDNCLGFIKGAKSACCGHGIKEGYIIWN